LFYDDGLSWEYQKQGGENISVEIFCEEKKVSVALEKLWGDANVSWHKDVIGK